jgi:hypothetical protein
MGKWAILGGYVLSNLSFTTPVHINSGPSVETLGVLCFPSFQPLPHQPTTPSSLPSHSNIMTLGTLLYAIVLVINSVAILSEDRFLARGAVSKDACDIPSHINDSFLAPVQLYSLPCWLNVCLTRRLPSGTIECQQTNGCFCRSK